MVRSRLPVPSLLGLFGALLMLSPELLMGNPEGLSDLPFTDPGVYRAYTFAVEQYNQDRSDSTTFFKVLQFLRAQSRSQVTDRVEYCLKLELVKTVCKKMAGRRGIYKHFEKCKQFPSTQEKPTCFFKVTLGSSPNERNLEKTACSTSGTPPPNDLFCSG